MAIFPFLKYPANPPGVGEPESIGYRQTLYVGFIALAVLGLGAGHGAPAPDWRLAHARRSSMPRGRSASTS